MLTNINNYSDYEKFLNNTRKGVIFYGSKRCGHCIKIKPFVEQLSRRYPSIRFAYVETTEVEVEGISGVPLFVAYLRKEAVDMLLGADEKRLVSMIEQELVSK